MAEGEVVNDVYSYIVGVRVKAHRFLMFVGMLTVLALAGERALPRKQSSQQMLKIVAAIQRADYEGDREALSKLHDQLILTSSASQVNSRVSYWRGFALWRRALNGFNESAPQQELQADLDGAVADFDQAMHLDPEFADAKAAEAGCLMSLMFLNQKNEGYVKGTIPKLRKLAIEAQAAAPDNPRVLWVIGGGLWYRPVEAGGGQQKAMETYERGLKLLREPPSTNRDPLEPAWGEPELLMSLAWSNLHRAEPDLVAAEQRAREALKLVPYWHYVRDILLPQIVAAKTR